MNMLTLLKSGFIWCGILLSFSCFGQFGFGLERSPVPLGALPMQYNGSFAGERGGPRFSANLGYAYYKPGSHFNTTISYDQFIPAIRSGIGITVGTGARQSGESVLNYSSKDNGISLAIAPKFSIKGKVTISPSLDFTYNVQNFKYREGDYFDTIRTEMSGKYHFLQSKAGLLLNTNKFYIGYSVFMLDKLKYKNDTYDRVRYIGYNSYLQLGYSFQRSSTSKFSFTPQLAFQLYNLHNLQGSSNIFMIDLVGINLNFRYNKIIWGVNNSGIHVGWQTEKFRLMLTNDVGHMNSLMEKANVALYNISHRNKISHNNISYPNVDYLGNLSFRYIIKNKNQTKF